MTTDGHNEPLLGGFRTGNTASVKEASVAAVKMVFKASPVNYLVAFVPLGLLAGYLEWSSSAIFWLNFLSIMPLASILSFATEELAEHVGDTVGGLLNATLGNAVELIVSLIALKNNQIRIVQALMLGSILSNLLLVLGCCFLAGGINRVQQSFNQTVAQTMSSLMAVSTASLLIPAAFHSTLPKVKGGNSDYSTYDGLIVSLSRGVSIVLLFIYLFYLIFQLKTHRSLFEEQPQDLDDDIVAAPGPSVDNGPSKQNNDHMALLYALGTLLVTTILVSVSADYLVGSIDGIVESSGLSKTFIGLIVIPIVGNAAEHVTAVVVATKDKMDLAIGVALGSSLQIALFVTPFMVLVGWIMDVPMSLYFSTFETAVLIVAVLITDLVILDGELNWLEGVMLLGTYFIIALAMFYYPDQIKS